MNPCQYAPPAVSGYSLLREPTPIEAQPVCYVERMEAAYVSSPLTKTSLSLRAKTEEDVLYCNHVTIR